MNTPKNKYSYMKGLLVAFCAVLTCLSLAGLALAEIAPAAYNPVEMVIDNPETTGTIDFDPAVEETDNIDTENANPENTEPENNDTDSTEPDNEGLQNNDPENQEPVVEEAMTNNIEVIEPAAQASFPAKYGGTVQYANGEPVPWDEIAAYIDLNGNGEIDSAEIPNPDHNKRTKENSGLYTIGQYSLPLNDHINLLQLVVNCPEDTACNGMNVIFIVKVGGVTYSAQTDPAPVKWYSNDLKQVNLTITSQVGIKGYAYLEKVYPTDPALDHTGTMVKVKQGGSTYTKYTNASGYYEVTGLSEGACTIEFTNSSAAWKKVTRSASVGASGLTLVSPVNMYLGDVNQDGSINLSDLLFLSNRIGVALGDTQWSELGDVNNDNVINILDLIRVNQNIGK